MPLPGWHSFNELLRFILRSSKRAAILVIGVALCALGIVLIPLPGPGFLVVILGLAVLATEFVWAEAMLDRVKEQATKAKDSIWDRIRPDRR
jgi:uncharacterized protein (TIGR02611 family)